MQKNASSMIATLIACYLTACATPDLPTYYYQPAVVYPDALPEPIIVSTPPPAPLLEEGGTAPLPQYIWIAGAWVWENNQYVWHKGYWSVPRPGYTWVPHRWLQENNRWRMHGGHWIKHEK